MPKEQKSGILENKNNAKVCLTVKKMAYFSSKKDEKYALFNLSETIPPQTPHTRSHGNGRKSLSLKGEYDSRDKSCCGTNPPVSSIEHCRNGHGS